MNITLISAFRNATGYIDRYIRQASALDVALAYRGDSLNFVLGEGDSTDDTVNRLEYFLRGADGVAVDCTHGGSLYGPVVDAQRFKQLAYVGNCLWAAIPESADVVIFVESDLIWDTATMLALLADLDAVPCVAPMIMDSPPANTWYDTWAFRRGGVNFTKARPYHPDIADGLLQLDSAGSCLLMKAELARHLTWPEESVIVGVCSQINQLGASVWLDPALTIYHP